MIVLPSNKVAYFDVDDTLVMWSPTQEQLDKEGIEIECPPGIFYDEDDEGISSPPWKAKIVPHKAHVEQIKKHKMRGHYVIVWSAGGYDWAEAAVNALGLEPYVDLVICKPVFCYDDMPPDRILPKIQYLEDK